MTCKHKQAFSLVELMVAIGIISILVSLAVPRYQAFIARGRMAEAKVNLGHIASLQGIYRAEWNAYASIGGVGNVGGSSSCTDNALGFVPDGCDDLRYGYSSDNTFSATAKNGDEIYPGCTVPDKDTWRVTKDNFKVKQIVNIVKHCQ